MAGVRDERWVEWRVYWSAVWVGALAALATALVIGLVGVAVGAHQIGPAHRIVTWKEYRLAALIFSVFGGFLSFVVGGWVAATIAGFRRSEPAMLHGAVAWLVTVPMLLAFAALGTASYFGGWYSGLAGMPAWATSTPPLTDPNAAAAARNSAVGALTALLLGLVGGVIGGWMASGEPMTFTYHRRRDRGAA
jgi:hypothetical protein